MIIASNGEVTKAVPTDQKKLRELRTLKQHYYPEGGWGWVVVLATFLCNALTTGLLLSGPALSLSLTSDGSSQLPVLYRVQFSPLGL